MTPIAICYLGQENDSLNLCRLYHNRFEVIRDGRAHSYELEGLLFEFSRKKWMLPLIGGGVTFSLSLLLIFRHLFHPWLSMFLLIGSMFSLYIGWKGAETMIVKSGGLTHLIPIPAKTPQLDEFIRFVSAYITESQGTLLTIYHLTTESHWESFKEASEYRDESLETEGFIHCSKREQVMNSYKNYFKGQENLVLLSIDALKLTSELKYEQPKDRVELFPHIYGPINNGAIIKIQNFNGSAELSSLLIN